MIKWLEIEMRESEIGLKCPLIVEIVTSHSEEDWEGWKIAWVAIVLFNTGATIKTGVVDCAWALELT